MKRSLSGGHCRGHTSSLFINREQLRENEKMLMISVDALRAYQGPHAWSEHLPYGAFGS